MPADRPVSPFPPIRVYMDIPDGSTLQLMPIRGMDMLEPSDDDPDAQVALRVFHAFGPPFSIAPPIGRLRVEPEDPNLRVYIRTFQDEFGIRRFMPICPLSQTSN